MTDQQTLIDRIVALAIAISTNPTATKFVDVEYRGLANQLSLTFITRDSHRRDSRSIDLHEPGEPEISRERVCRLLREELTNLQALHSKSTIPQQRRFSV